MKKVKGFAIAVLVLITCAAFPAASLPSDAQVEATAKEWGIPADALKRLVDSYRPSTASAGDFVSVSAKDLAAAYEENPAKADFTYKGKVLHIKGTWGTTQTTDFGPTKYYVQMNGVQVYFPTTEIEKTFDFVKGQEIEVEGTVYDLTIMGTVRVKATKILF